MRNHKLGGAVLTSDSMMKIHYAIIFFIVGALGSVPRAAAQMEPQASGIPRVIFDSDMGPDYDDVGAIAILHAYADSGYVDLLATIASTRYKGVASVLNLFNTYFNRPDLPIAVPASGLDMRDPQGWTDSLIARYPHRIESNAQVPDAVSLYRKILAAQPDGSVTLITVGFLTNIAALMQSGPDRYSQLDGMALIEKKVDRMVSMAGKFPSGTEFNLVRDTAAAYYVLHHWRKPLLFSGFEIGKKIKVGLRLIGDASIQSSPVKDVYRICMRQDEVDSAGRMSWDLTAVLVAVKGSDPYYNLRRGRVVVHQNAAVEWSEQASGNQAYLLERMNYKDVEALLEKTMMHQPVKLGRARTGKTK